MRPTLASLVVLLTLPASAADDPPLGKARLARVLGHSEMAHPRAVRSLVSLEGGALLGVDEASGTFAPAGPLAGARCTLQTPLAALGNTAISPGARGFVLCDLEGKTREEAPDEALSPEPLTALAARRETDGRTRYVWGDSAGTLSSWRAGTAVVRAATAGAGPIRAVASLADGSVIALAGNGKVVRWDGKSGAAKTETGPVSSVCPLDQEPCPKGTLRVTAFVLSAEGDALLVSTAAPGFEGYGIGPATTRMYRLGLSAPKLEWERKGTLSTAAAFLDKDSVALAVSSARPPDWVGPSRIEVVQRRSGKPLADEPPPSSVLAVQFSPDGRSLASGHANGALALWDVFSGERRALVNVGAGPLVSLAFAPDGKRIALQPEQGPARWADGTSGKGLGALAALTGASAPPPKPCRQAAVATDEEETEAELRELAFSPDGAQLLATYVESRCASFKNPCAACAETYTPARVSVSDGKLLDRWEEAEGSLLAQCSAALGVPVTPAEEGGAVAWSSEGKVIGRLGGPGAPASFCAVGGASVVLAAGNALYVQPKVGGSARRVPLSREAAALAVSPNGQLALAATTTEVRLVSLSEGRSLEVLPLSTSGDEPRTLAFSPDGKAFAVGTKRGVVLEFELLEH